MNAEKKTIGIAYNAHLMESIATQVSETLHVPLGTLRDPASRGIAEANARAIAIALANAMYPRWEPKDISEYFHRDTALAAFSIKRVSQAIQLRSGTPLARDARRMCTILTIEPDTLIVKK